MLESTNMQSKYNRLGTTAQLFDADIQECSNQYQPNNLHNRLKSQLVVLIWVLLVATIERL